MKLKIILSLAISAVLLSSCSSEVQVSESDQTENVSNISETQNGGSEPEASIKCYNGYFLQTENGCFFVSDTRINPFYRNELVRIEPADDTVSFDDLKTGDKISAGVRTIITAGDSEPRFMKVYSMELLESGDISNIEMSVINELKRLDITFRYASPEEIQQIISGSGYPEIMMNENSTAEEIMLAGKIAGKFFAAAAEKYFKYGINTEWKYNRSIGAVYICFGPYTDKEYGIYAPMTGEESKQFLMDYIRLTEKGYEELCLNSPSRYEINDGEFYVYSGDGGEAGWSFSRIVGYELGENELGEKTVTYNCERVGTAEEWGYEADMIKPFTVRLAYEDGFWKLDGVSYGEGFFELMWLEYNDVF